MSFNFVCGECGGEGRVFIGTELKLCSECSGFGTDIKSLSKLAEGYEDLIELAYQALWVVFVWNDKTHDFHPKDYLRYGAKKVGISTFQDFQNFVNTWNSVLASRPKPTESKVPMTGIPEIDSITLQYKD